MGLASAARTGAARSMRRFAVILIACAAFAEDLATPRSDPKSQAAHLQLLDKARQGGIDIYFEGDSITRRWGASDPEYSDLLANWKQNFFGWNAADFGWGGDTVQNVLWRVENGELDGVNPKIIVLMAGTNNLGKDNAVTVTTITRGIRAILDAMRQKAPGAAIILMGITPRKELMSVIDEINAAIAAFADGKNIRYLNINARLGEGATVDGLHLSVKGYQVWADALKPMFRELLGPPGETDHAPPPTGVH